MLLAAAIVSVATTVILVGSGNVAAELLSFAGAAALLLRGRLFPAPAQRVPLLVAGAFGLALLLFGLAVRQHNAGVRLLLLVAILVVAALVLIAGLVYSRRTPSPHIGRLADIADVLAIMALLPFACGVVGVYHAIQGLFASFGG